VAVPNQEKANTLFFFFSIAGGDDKIGDVDLDNKEEVEEEEDEVVDKEQGLLGTNHHNHHETKIITNMRRRTAIAIQSKVTMTFNLFIENKTENKISEDQIRNPSPKTKKDESRFVPPLWKRILTRKRKKRTKTCEMDEFQ